MALSDAQVRAAKWDGKDYYLNDGNGLYLYVRKVSKVKRRPGWVAEALLH
jgi:hypothetical protein